MELVKEMRKIESTAKDWEVVKFNNKAKAEVNPVVARSLELRGLELDVQEWTEEFNGTISKEDWAEVKSILDGHARDEDNHDIVLGYLAEYWNSTEVSDEAKLLIKRWQDLPTNSMVKKTFLEAGVFFSLLPLITRYSNYDGYTSRVADWIMSDEVRHVRSSRLLVKYFGLKGSKRLLGLIEETIRYILQSEPEEVINKWVKRSYDIAIKGSCDDFSEDSLRTVVRHFDQESRQEVIEGYAY